ncbi:hypothetical protein BCR42DRAFT_315563 [Absidia repens]|uniref:Alpha/Beta hydrolase protein n=1 Tax=Absidia repens TaxID=90262 RepID=A0A1X2J2U6_9FUNG|nr:hypothetical protein BCR42DRAFT_315563 [Absidia repens]
MASSQSEIVVNGLKLSVYGLAEYKRLPENTPVAVMFALHGRLQNKSKMDTIAQVLCSLNNVQRQQQQRHLLVVTFDHANHGSRLTDKKANFSWKEGKHENPTHAIDMYSMVRAGATSVSELIDVLEYHLFGATCRPVQCWGCIGFSMGGHSTFFAAANGKPKPTKKKKKRPHL